MKRLHVLDLESISFLLNEGLSIREVLTVMGCSSLTRKIKAGESTAAVLAENMPLRLRESFLSFLKILSLQEALALCLEMNRKERERKKYLEQKLSYPILLFFASFIGLGVFDRFGISSFSTFLGSYEKGMKQLLLFQMLIRGMYFFFWGAVLLMVLLAALLYKKDRRILFYRFLYRFFPHNPVTLLLGQEFVAYWCLCAKAGLGSKDSFRILRCLKGKTMLKFVAYHLEEALEAGKELREATKLNYMDPFFTHFVTVAYYHESPILLFEKYLTFSRRKLETWIKKSSRSLVIFVYLFIGFLIVVIYQILLLPMQALSRF